MPRLQDRVALVTGTGGGANEAIARAMAAEGASVILTDVEDSVAETAENIKKSEQRALFFNMDIRDMDEVSQTVDKIVAHLGKVDILVTSAGIYPSAMFIDMPNEIRDLTFDVNIKGVWNCAKAVVPNMIRQHYGKIINISSVTGPMVAMKGMAAYAASKGAVSGLTRALALELAGYGINVNAICTGYMDFPKVREMVSKRGIDPAQWSQRLSKSIPLGRLGSLEDIGSLAVFLASDESKYVTGTETVLDGGNIIQEEARPSGHNDVP